MFDKKKDVIEKKYSQKIQLKNVINIIEFYVRIHLPTHFVLHF